jgi:hypothetical protein
VRQLLQPLRLRSRPVGVRARLPIDRPRDRVSSQSRIAIVHPIEVVTFERILRNAEAVTRHPSCRRSYRLPRRRVMRKLLPIMHVHKSA